MFKELVNNIFKFFLNFIPSKYLRAKLKADWTKNFIKKYVEIAVNSYKERNFVLNQTPAIYQYWEQGIEAMPDIIKVCTNSIDEFEPDLKHIILDYKNVEDYVEIPSFVYDLKNKGKISIAQFSDILRSCLLAQGGAVWMDSTILLTGALPYYIKQSEFFMYKGLKKTPEQFAGANFFIFSKRPNPLTVELKDAVLEYWKDNNFQVSYFLHPHFITLLSEKNKPLWDSIPVYDEQAMLGLAKILFDKYDEEVFLQTTANFPIHKLSYKIPKRALKKLNETYYQKIKEKLNA